MIELIGHGPQENPLHTCSFIGREFLAAHIRRADEKENSRIDSSHPPTASRIKFIKSRHYELPVAILSDSLSRAIDQELQDVSLASHLRFSIFPDGGVSRLRVYGTLD